MMLRMMLQMMLRMMLQAETEIGAAHQLMSMAHDYRHKNDMTGSSSVPNLDSGDALMMSPQRQPYHHYQQQQPQPQQQPQHHHYRCSSRQQQQQQQQQTEDNTMYPQSNLQSSRSRSVPSVAAAAATMDPYASHASLYGAEGHHHHPMGNDGYSCDNYYGDKSFTTFRGGYNAAKPCYANGRCQSRQKAALVRQASAGYLPPDHRGNYMGDRVASANNLQHTNEDLGYKSDGEGYKSDGGGCYRGCASAGPQRFRNQPFVQHGAGTGLGPSP